MSEPTAEKQDEVRWGSARLREQDRRAPQRTAGPRKMCWAEHRSPGAESACCTSPQSIPADYRKCGRRGKELNLLPLPCAGSALPMSYAPLGQSIRLMKSVGHTLACGRRLFPKQWMAIGRIWLR